MFNVPDHRCSDCDWLAEALLDGDRDKALCHYGLGQGRPFGLLPGKLHIVHLQDRACSHYERFEFGSLRTDRG